MNKTTSDPGTPIFGQLNEELGELPEITIHDFDWHGFDFPTDVEQAESSSASAGKAEKSTTATPTAAKSTTAKSRSASKSTGEPAADTAAPKTRTTKSGTSTGGRRRKEP